MQTSEKSGEEEDNGRKKIMQGTTGDGGFLMH